MEPILVLSSITYAMKARDLLKDHGIPSLLTRSAAIRRVRGCGYGVRIAPEHRTQAEALLQDAEIHVLGIAFDKQ